jgi:hypothetical protein
VEAILPILIGQAWAAGLNAYGVILLLNVGTRLGFAEVPEPFDANWVLALSAIMFSVEFVADKIPYVDHVWDVIHTAVRPGLAAALGIATAGDVGASELGAGLGSGALALASHATKAGLRVAINTSPEPVTTTIASSIEDGLVATVIGLLFVEPWLGAVAAAFLLLIGFVMLAVAWKAVRAVRRRLSSA